MKEKGTVWGHSAMLLLAAIIWGFAFAAQSAGMDYLPPFAFNGIRYLLGTLVLLPFLFIGGRKWRKKGLLRSGLSMGLILFLATSCQQIGIQYTSVGKAGFITAFYIVLVPLFSLFLGRRNSWKIWFSVLLALAGLFLLTVSGSSKVFSLGKGELWILACSVFYSFHILAIDYFVRDYDPIALSSCQFFVSSVLSFLIAFLTEDWQAAAVMKAAIPLLYSGIFSCGVAYTLQIQGQKNLNPSVASLILSLEACFSVLGGWLLLRQKLSAREWSGCLLMFAAILIAQIRGRGKDANLETTEATP